MTSRKSASIKTALSGLALQIIALIFGFINQRIFIQTLGIEYSGINGTIGNILSILTLSDLGVSAAVVYHLYKALATNDETRVASIMRFYRTACRIFTAIIILGGLAMLPFAQVFVGETTISDNIYIIFFLYIIIASLQYAFNYRRALLNADQKGYIVNSVMCVATLVLYIVKIIVLTVTKNFYIYAICIIVEKLCENLIISQITKKKYQYLNKIAPLPKTIRTDIKKKMYASVYHNSASYVVKSTDNIIIAQIFGAAMVGFCNNYHMIISAINTLITQIFNGAVASLGNLLASSEAKRAYDITKSMFLANFWFYATTSIAIFFCLPSFISIWVGSEYVLNDGIVIALVLNFFITGMRITPNNTLNGAGVLYENRFVPIVEAIINLVSSIVFAKIFGVIGVFIGTILSSLFLHLYSYPKYVFKLVLGKSRIEYILIFAKYLTLFILSWAGIGLLMPFINFENNFAEFVIRGFISVVLPSLFYYLIFFKTEEFKYLYSIIKNFPSKIKQKIFNAH